MLPLFKLLFVLYFVFLLKLTKLLPNITTLLVGKIDLLKVGIYDVIDDDIVSANVFSPGIIYLLNICWLLESLIITEFGLAFCWLILNLL